MCSWDQDLWKGREEKDQPEEEAYLGYSLNGNQADPLGNYLLDNSEDGISPEGSDIGVKGQGLYVIAPPD